MISNHFTQEFGTEILWLSVRRILKLENIKTNAITRSERRALHFVQVAWADLKGMTIWSAEPVIQSFRILRAWSDIVESELIFGSNITG